jgi:hypothetical protein
MLQVPGGRLSELYSAKVSYSLRNYEPGTKLILTVTNISSNLGSCILFHS